MLTPWDKFSIVGAGVAAVAGLMAQSLGEPDLVQYGALGIVALVIYRLFFDVLPGHRKQMDQWRLDMREDRREYLKALTDLTDQLKRSTCPLGRLREDDDGPRS